MIRFQNIQRSYRPDVTVHRPTFPSRYLNSNMYGYEYKPIRSCCIPKGERADERVWWIVVMFLQVYNPCLYMFNVQGRFRTIGENSAQALERHVHIKNIYDSF
ncbi:hypothetical protein CBL_13188 [Carabus blaptoides fortunei]